MTGDHPDILQAILTSEIPGLLPEE